MSAVQHRHLLLIALMGLSVVATFFGLRFLMGFDQTAGAGAEAPARWPVASAIHRLGGRPTLLVFAHPYCGCTEATVGELDAIKLDRSFVNREFANASAIIDSVIEMAHRIGLRVVAEGIETATQSNRLMDLNCDEQQGFYFSAPVPADSVAGFLASRRTENSFAA